jgi:hypothetical protein
MRARKPGRLSGSFEKLGLKMARRMDVLTRRWRLPILKVGIFCYLRDIRRRRDRGKIEVDEAARRNLRVGDKHYVILKGDQSHVHGAFWTVTFGAF